MHENTGEEIDDLEIPVNTQSKLALTGAKLAQCAELIGRSLLLGQCQKIQARSKRQEIVTMRTNKGYRAIAHMR